MENTFDVCNPDEWNLGRFREYKVFNKKALKKIHSWIENQEWEDGLRTLSWNSEKNAHSLKKNDATKTNIPDDLIWPYLNKNRSFYDFTHAKTSCSAMCTRTSVGGYYKPHFDNVTNGQFSTTIFLSKPEEYEGGELVLWIDGKEVFFKPKAGRAVTYETGIGHRVNPVTKGERYALVFWTFSKWQNLDIFHSWKYYDFMCKYTHNPDETIVNTLDEHYNIPYNRLRTKLNYFERLGNPKTE